LFLNSQYFFDSLATGTLHQEQIENHNFRQARCRSDAAATKIRFASYGLSLVVCSFCHRNGVWSWAIYLDAKAAAAGTYSTAIRVTLVLMPRAASPFTSSRIPRIADTLGWG